MKEPDIWNHLNSLSAYSNALTVPIEIRQTMNESIKIIHYLLQFVPGWTKEKVDKEQAGD